MNKKVITTAVAAVVTLSAAAGFGLTATQSQAETPAKKEAAPAPEKAADKKAETAAPAAAAAPAESDNPVVAKVEGTEIHRSDVAAFLSNLPPQMRQLPPETVFPMALEQVVNAKIVDLKAQKTDTAQSPEVAKRLEEAKVQITRAVYVEKEIEKAFSEGQVKKAYDKMVADMGKVEEVHARHILVEKEDLAKDIIKQLAAGAKFDDLAKKYSTDSANKASGGDLGYFTKDTMDKTFAEAAFKLNKGESSKEPVKTQFGYHIIQVEDKRVKPAPSYETVKDQLAGQVRRDILNNLVEGWRKSAKVELFDINGKPVAKKDEAKK